MGIFNRSFFLGMVAGPLLLIGLLIIVVVAASPFLAKSSREKMEKNLKAPIPPASVRADYNWTLQDLDGNDFELSSLEGKTVFLGFWSPSCGHCVVDMKHLQELYDTMNPEGVEFVCVSKEKYKDAVIKFREKYQRTIPMFTFEGDSPEAYPVKGTPTAFILSPDGTIAWEHHGAARWNEEVTHTYLRGLLMKQ